jgi:hypothetical protein
MYPYVQHLDAEATARVESLATRFDADDLLLKLYQLDHPAATRSAAPPAPPLVRDYFERLRLLFAQQTAHDRLLRGFVAREADLLFRAKVIFGKLTVLPILTNDEAVLSLSLSQLRSGIWVTPDADEVF